MLKRISSKLVKRNVTAAFIFLHPFTEASNFAFCPTNCYTQLKRSHDVEKNQILLDHTSIDFWFLWSQPMCLLHSKLLGNLDNPVLCPHLNKVSTLGRTTAHWNGHNKKKPQRQKTKSLQGNLRIYCYGLFTKVRHLSNITKMSALNYPYTLLPKCLASCQTPVILLCNQVLEKLFFLQNSNTTGKTF